MAGLAVEITGLDATVKRLIEMGADMPKIRTRAENRTLAEINTLAARGIAKDLGMPTKFAARSIDVTRATWSKPGATLTVTGYRREDGRIPDKSRKAALGRIPLFAFNARGPVPSKGRGRGVSYKLPSGRGRIDRAFIAKMQSGHEGVFGMRAGPVRRSPKSWGPNLPITELFGPSPQHVFRRHILADAIKKGSAALEKHLNHEINYAISQRTPSGDE